MSAYRRPTSPNGSRIYLEAPRVTTGTVLTTSYDTRYDQRAPRASFSSVPSSSQSSGSRHSSIYETQPLSKRVYNDSSTPGATISRTEYAVRPRRNSGSVEPRRPLSLMTNKLASMGEFTESPRDLAPYKSQQRQEQPRLLTPAHSGQSVHHQRHNSATRAETGRSFTTPSTPRVDRGYHSRGPYVEKVSSSRPAQSLVRYEEPTFEYTNAREQFDRDFPAPAIPVAPVVLPAKSKNDTWNKRERPSSAIGSRFESLPFRREHGPPPTVRQIHKLDRDDRRSGFESDPDRPSEHRPSRTSHHRHAPVTVLHQRDDGYSSSRDDFDSRRALVHQPRNDDLVPTPAKPRYRDSQPELDRDYGRDRDRDYDRHTERDKDRDRERERDRDRDRDRHERRHSVNHHRNHERDRDQPRTREGDMNDDDDSSRRTRRRQDRSKESSPERSGLKSVATAALGGLVSAGVLGHKSRKEGDASESDEKKEHGRHHRRRRSRDPAADQAPEEEERHRRRRSRGGHQSSKQESSGSDTPEEAQSRQRPRSRTRQRTGTVDGYSSEPDRAVASMTAADGEQRQPLPTQQIGAARDDVAARSQQTSPIDPEARTISPGENQDGRPRKVSIVEPNKDSKLAIRPKGILKPPRSTPFPEDPNPTREGVAPLKQAGKDGIPSGARWTKISRILVNPEALERYQERFEERDDYVIVLRVLSREEIEKLAEKTREIREQREREWQKEVEERKRRRAERGQHDERESDSADGYDVNDAKEQQLAIEPAGAPPTDLRQLVQSSTPQSQSQPQMAYMPQQGYAPQQMDQLVLQPQPLQQHQQQQSQPLPPPPPSQFQQQYQPAQRQEWQYPVASLNNQQDQQSSGLPAQQQQQQQQQQPQQQRHQAQAQQLPNQQQQETLHPSQWQPNYSAQQPSGSLDSNQMNSAHNSAERIAATAPGQPISPLPEQDQHHVVNSSAYSQNV